jgi:hypothetical protein
VYCADDDSWWAFGVREDSPVGRLEAEELFVDGALCAGHTKAMYSTPSIGGGARESFEGFSGVAPKFPTCEPGCCPDIPVWARESSP